MRVLLTGATGSIGRVVTRSLVARGWQVRVLARPGTESEIPRNDRIEVVAGTLADHAVLERATLGVPVVIHLAGLLPGEPDEALARVNVAGTANVAAACARNRVGRLVFVSSTSVYRDAANPVARGISETAPLLAEAFSDIERYGLSKLAAEQQVLQAHRASHLPFVIIRAPVVYGTDNGWETRVIDAVRRQPWATLARLPALPTLQCVRVDDLARGIMVVTTHPAATNQVFNMAGAELFSFRDVGHLAFDRVPAARAARAVRYDTRLKYEIGKARSVVGFAPAARLFSSAAAY